MDSAFSAVADALAGYARDGDYGAQLTVIVGGDTVIDAHVGPGVDGSTLFPVFSCSKGAATACMAVLVERGMLDLDARVAHYWPEFAQAGKGGITVRQALSHQAGLVDVEGGLDWAEVLDDAAGARRLAAQRPLWHPGIAHGYHALTLGIIMGELSRRIDGRSLQVFFDEEIRAPRNLDVYLGLPESLDTRVSAIDAMRLTPDQELERRAVVARRDSLEALPYRRLRWNEGGRFEMSGSRAGRAAGMPAAGGIASARGLAELYAAMTGLGSRDALFSRDTQSQFAQVQTAGTDLVLGRPGRFGVGFQKPDPERPFGSYRAFGHDGACGALAFADPEYDLAFGYIPRRQPYPGGCDPRAVELSLLLGELLR